MFSSWIGCGEDGVVTVPARSRKDRICRKQSSFAVCLSQPQNMDELRLLPFSDVLFPNENFNKNMEVAAVWFTYEARSSYIYNIPPFFFHLMPEASLNRENDITIGR